MRASTLLALFAIGCGPSTARAPEPPRQKAIELPPATSEAADSTPSVSRRPHCEIRGKRNLGSVSLFVASDDTAPAAFLLRTSETELSWSGFRHGRAAIAFRVERVLRFDGFASYDDDWFRVARRIEVVHELAWSWRGAAARPEADADDGGLSASFETPFETPARLEGHVDCDAIAFEDIDAERPSMPENTEALWRPGPELHLYAEPSGPEAFTARFRTASGSHRGTARVPGWVRIIEIGNALAIEAWVEESAFQKPPNRLGGSHRVRPPRIRSDSVAVTVPSAEVQSNGPLYVGAAANRVLFGEIEAGAVVQIWERDGDWVGVLFESRWVAPKDAVFWLEKRLLGPERPAK